MEKMEVQGAREDRSAGRSPPIRTSPTGAVTVRSLTLRGIFLLLFFFSLYFGREFFLPVALAVILSLVLRPAMRVLEQTRLPDAISAALLLLAFLAILACGAYLLSDPATRVMAQVPQTLQKTEEKFRRLLQPAAKLKEASQQMERIADAGTQPTEKVQLKRPSVTGMVLGWTKAFVFQAGSVFVLLYFLLAGGDRFIQQLVGAFPRAAQRRDALKVALEMEKSVSRYLFTITLINFAEGGLLAFGLWLAQMPNPLLWGVAAALLNYIPYLGFLTGVTILTLVSFVHFDSLIHALIPSCIYFGIAILDQFVSPLVQGRSLKLNPVLVFLSLLFWGWLWGLAGVFLAVPILMTIKIVCDHLPGDGGLAAFLEG